MKELIMRIDNENVAFVEKKEFEKLKADNENIRNIAQNRINKVYALLEEITKLTKENEDLKKEIENRIKHTVEKNEHIQTVCAQRDKLKTENDELEKENSKLRFMVETPKTLVPESDLREAQDENRELEDRADNLEKYNAALIEANNEFFLKIENQKQALKDLEKAYHREKDQRKRDQINWGRTKKDLEQKLKEVEDPQNTLKGTATFKVNGEEFKFPATVKWTTHDSLEPQEEYCEISGAKLEKPNVFEEIDNILDTNKRDTDCKICEGSGKIFTFTNPGRTLGTFGMNFIGAVKEYHAICNECNGTGKNQRFLSQSVDCIILGDEYLKIVLKKIGINTIGELIDHTEYQLVNKIYFGLKESFYALGAAETTADRLYFILVPNLKRHGLKLKE